MSSALEPFITTSFINDLANSTPAQQLPGMAHTLVTGRKTWKTMKSQKEAVWPPQVEAALFDGKWTHSTPTALSKLTTYSTSALELYRPSSSGDPRLLRRFPKRNVFISNHIFKVTGKRRTAKQVGSRLQQLRDTCQEERVLKLLSRREFTPPPKLDARSHTSSSPASSPEPATPTLEAETPTTSPTMSRFLDAFSKGLNMSSPQDDATQTRRLPPRHVCLTIDLGMSLTPAPSVLHIPSINTNEVLHADIAGFVAPSVTFISPFPISTTDHQSLFCIFLEGRHIYSESTELVLLSSSTATSKTGPFVYGITIIPRFWGMLCNQPDVTKYTVSQDIIRSLPQLAGESVQDSILLTITYSFKPALPAPGRSTYELIPLPPQLQPDNSAIIYASPRPLLAETSNTFLSAQYSPIVPQITNQSWNDPLWPLDLSNPTELAAGYGIWSDIADDHVHGPFKRNLVDQAYPLDFTY